MTRDEIITQVKVYFKISDLVCPDTFRLYGERAWMFLDTTFLHTLFLVRRDILKAPMLCNNYLSGPRLHTQRGLRCNLCQIVMDKTHEGKVYLSAHTTGCAGDFDVVGMTSVQARHRIMDAADLLPFPVRMEDGVTWLHLDTYDSPGDEKVTLFSAK